MKFDPNDPKWTAYAFDELDSNERAGFEESLLSDPAAQQFVAELQATGQVLKSALVREPAAQLTAGQRATLANAFNDQPIAADPVAPLPKQRRHRRRWIAAVAAVAATWLIVALIPPTIQSRRMADSRVAKTRIEDEAAKLTSIQSIEHNSTTLYSEMTTQPGSAIRGENLQDHINYPASAASLSPPPTDSIASSSPRAMSVDVAKRVYETKSHPSDTVLSDTSFSSPTGTPVSISGASKGVGHDVKVQALTEPYDSDGLIAPTQIEFAEGLNQIAIPGNPQGLKDKVTTLLTEAETRGDGKPATPDERFREIPFRGDVRIENEAYDIPPENAFEPVAASPLSTFSIDVDTASYANIRRFLIQNNQLPPPAAVRTEEMLNYFRYEYPQPEGDVPFSVTTEVATCPWNTDHRLVRVGLKGKEIAKEKRPVSNLVFLLDVSGSMQDANKLPLVREAMKMLVRELSENDRVAIVVYAGASGMVLDSTTADQKDLIIAAIDQLQAGGSTNGAGGIQQAYDVALQHFIKGGTNRVILATDGDFNVGITDRGQLVKLIEDKAKSGVFLTTLGFGMGNLKDATLEQLADKGNGNYAYVDTLAEARKVFVEEMMGTLVTIAKDVKVQIEFNPLEVASYRLIGYENRKLAAEDFNDDKKDAGEIGAGHTVTALYELVPVNHVEATGQAHKPAETPVVSDGQASTGKASGTRLVDSGVPAGAALSGVDPLRYQKPIPPKVELTDAANNGELFTLKLRYKQPDGDTSKLIEHPVKDSGTAYREASGDFKFAASIAAFGMTLRHSQHRGTITLDGIKELAQEGRSYDPSGYRSEFVTLIEKAQSLGAK